MKIILMASVVFVLAITAEGIFIGESARITGVTGVPSYVNITRYEPQLYTTTENMSETVSKAPTLPDLDIFTVSIGGFTWILNTPFVIAGLVSEGLKSISLFGDIGYVGLAIFGILSILVVFFVYETFWARGSTG